jgi:hypothetical protein
MDAFDLLLRVKVKAVVKCFLTLRKMLGAAPEARVGLVRWSASRMVTSRVPCSRWCAIATPPQLA